VDSAIDVCPAIVVSLFKLRLPLGDGQSTMSHRAQHRAMTLMSRSRQGAPRLRPARTTLLDTVVSMRAAAWSDIEASVKQVPFATRFVTASPAATA
jgi:hypothetical protein